MRCTPALALAFALLCTSCEQPPEDPATRATAAAAEPPPPGDAGNAADPGDAAAPSAANATIRYACDDGSALDVRYVADRAAVELPDGRTVSLPKAQSASTPGSEAFVGEALALQREGDGIELHRDEQPTLRCRATGT